MLTQEGVQSFKDCISWNFAQVNMYRFQADSLVKLFCTLFLFAANLKIVEDDNAQPLAGTNSTFLSYSLLISKRHLNAVKLCLLTLKIDLYIGHFERTVFMMISTNQI